MAAIFSKILCPVDFEHDSINALEIAGRLAKQNAATVCLLSVIGEPLIPATELPPLPPSPRLESRCRERLEAIARENLAGVRHEVFVKSGDAAPQILNLAAEQKMDLIVMGTHGRSGLKLFLLGSVAERVVRESPVPVLTVHPKAAG